MYAMDSSRAAYSQAKKARFEDSASDNKSKEISQENDVLNTGKRERRVTDGALDAHD